MVPLPAGQVPQPMLASALMEDEEQHQNYDLIGELFDDATGAAILQVLISRFYAVDKLFWSDNSTSLFSVKYAYIIARLLMEKDIPSIDLKKGCLAYKITKLRVLN